MLARAEIKQVIRDVQAKLAELDAPGDDSPPDARQACERMIDVLTRALLDEPVNPRDIDALIHAGEHAGRWRRENYGIDQHAGRRLYWNDILVRIDQRKNRQIAAKATPRWRPRPRSGVFAGGGARAIVTGPMAVTEREPTDHPGPPPHQLTLDELRRRLRGVGDLEDLTPEQLVEVERQMRAEFERERDEWVRKTFAVRLRVARERAKLSQTQLAALAGGKTRRTHLARWEHANADYARLPRIDTRNRLADVLGVPRTHLIPELEVDG